MAQEDNLQDQTQTQVPQQKVVPDKKPPVVSKEQQAALDKLNFVSDNFGQIVGQNATDQNFFIKPFSYNPETTENPNQNFERYYSHTSFKKLGFNPWQDNEAAYNLKGSAWGDIWRATKAGARMIPSGFMSAIRSYGDIATGDVLAEDKISAEEMKRLNVIGSSSRGGTSGFASNLIVNAGYTVGLVAEMGTEATIGALLTPETGGASAAIAVGRVANTAKNLGKYFNVLEGFNKAVSSLKNFNLAKTTWDAFKATGKFINPLSNTFDAVKAMNNSENLTNLAKVSKTAAGFHKDVMMANATLSEAKVEGGYASTEIEDELIAKYYKENGAYPPTDELVKIKETAKQAGDKTLAWNIPIIMLTNKITFDPLFRRFAPMEDFITKAGTKFVEKKGVGFVAEGIGTGFKGLLKPKAYGKAALSYFKQNFSEGVQESLQDIISGTAKDYYRDVYSNASKQGLDQSTGENYTPDVSGILGKSVADQFSGKGFETFASGFFMGGLIKIQGALYQGAQEGYNRVFNKERYQEYRKNKDEYDKQTLERLNELYKDPLKYFGSRIVNYGNGSNTVENQNEASATNDKKVWQDVDDQNVWSHIMTALDTGTYDIFLDKLSDIKTMDPKAIQEAYGVDGQEVLGKINKVTERASYLKDSYEKWNARAVNPFNPKAYPKDTPEYQREAIAYTAWEQAKKNAIFYGYSFDRNVDRIRSVQDELLRTATFQNIPASDITNILDVPSINKELSLLKKEISTLKSAEGADAKSELGKKQRKFEKLTEFRSALENYFIYQSAQQLPKKEQKAFFATFKDFEKTTDKELKQSYKNYLKHLAAQNNVFYFSDINVDESYKALKDLHTLRSENRNLNETINMLSNPKGFHEHYDRLNKHFSELYDGREQTTQDGLKATYSRIELNNLLNNLYRLGYTIGDKDIQQILDGEIPEQFYSVVSKQVVKKGERDYLAFEAIINDFLSAQKGEPVTEEVKTEEKAPEAKPEEPVTKTEEKKPKVITPYDIQQKLDAIKTGADFVRYENEIMAILGNYDKTVDEGIDKDIEAQIFKELKDKEKMLVESFNPKDLQVGNVVQMFDKNYDKMVVKKITSTDVYFQKAGDGPNLNVKMKKDNLQKAIKFKYSDTMAEFEALELTADEKQKAEQNLQTADNLMQDTATLKELQVEAKKEGVKKVTDEFIKNLGCK